MQARDENDSTKPGDKPQGESADAGLPGTASSPASSNETAERKPSGRSSQDSQKILRLARSTGGRSEENSDDEQVDPLVGKIFADKYRILSVLGHGGMSVVYLARHEGLNKLRAIKTLHAHLITRSSSIQRFKNEAQAVSGLSHPNIVTVYDYGVTPESIPYLVMDYVQGEPLDKLMERVGTLLPKHALEIFVQACAGMAHAHSKSIVHRDLKPSNIMVDNHDGETIVRIVDFGVAKVLQETESAKLTQTGEAVGSPLYMSPEQCQGLPQDERSDVYSMGCVMYEALTGIAPFAADSVYGTLFKQTTEIPKGFQEVRPGLTKSESFEKIVFKALAKNPEDRQQSMNELRQDLLKIADTQRRTMFNRFQDKWELRRLKSSRKKDRATLGWIIMAGALTLSLIALVCVCLVSASGVQPWQPAEAVPPDMVWPRYPDEVALQASNASPLQQRINEGLRERFLRCYVRDHRDPEEQIGIAIQYGDYLRGLHQYDEAAPRYSQAYRLIRTSSAAQNVSFKCALKSFAQDVDYKLADCYYYSGQYSVALPLFKEAVTLSADEKDDKDLVHEHQRYLLATLKLADCFYYQRAGKSNPDLEQAYSLMNDVRQLEVTSRNSRTQRDMRFALYCSKLADCGLRLGEFKDCLQVSRSAIAEWAGISSDEQATRNLILAMGTMARALDASQDTPEAETMYTRMQLLIDRIPAQKDIPIAAVLQDRARMLWRTGHYIEAFKTAKVAEKYRR